MLNYVWGLVVKWWLQIFLCFMVYWDSRGETRHGLWAPPFQAMMHMFLKCECFHLKTRAWRVKMQAKPKGDFQNAQMTTPGNILTTDPTLYSVWNAALLRKCLIQQWESNGGWNLKTHFHDICCYSNIDIL